MTAAVELNSNEHIQSLLFVNLISFCCWTYLNETCMGEKKNACMVLVWKTKGKGPLGNVDVGGIY